MNLIMVTLNCGNDFNIHKQTYENYFNNYTAITALNKGSNYILNEEICVENNCVFIIKNEEYRPFYIYYEIYNTLQKVIVYLYDENNYLIEKKEVNIKS